MHSKKVRIGLLGRGWIPSKPYVEELFDIAIELKLLDKKVKS